MAQIHHITYRQGQLKKQADQLLAEGKKLNDIEQKKLMEVLLELESLDIKVTDSDNVMNNHASHGRKRKKNQKNSQYKLPLP